MTSDELVDTVYKTVFVLGIYSGTECILLSVSSQLSVVCCPSDMTSSMAQTIS